MNTEIKTAQAAAHIAATKAAEYKCRFTRIAWTEIIFATLVIPLGILTFPIGIFMVILGGMSIMGAINAFTSGEQAYQEFMKLREKVLDTKNMLEDCDDLD